MRTFGLTLRLAAVALTAAAALAGLGAVRAADDPAAQATEQALERYRAMLKADPWSNPALLDVDRGEALWKAKRGPRRASLEACDLGQGPGKVDGAYARLPRYFRDAGRVMDTEARLIWCSERLQGLKRSDIVQPWPGAGQPTTDLGALTAYVAHRSKDQPFAVEVKTPQERQALALGEALFRRRMGPLDFACDTCHGEKGLRIRLQQLPKLSDPEDARKAIGEWPAYRVSTSHVMTMEHRIYDCFWQMRLPQLETGSDVAVALTLYLTTRASGGAITAPGLKR